MRPRCLRRSAIAALLFAGLLVAPPAPAQGTDQGPADGSQTRVDYVLRATVQPETMQLEGDGTVTWHNASADAVSDLWFHLHLNAYSNNLTTHLWESEGKLRGEKIESGWSYQQVTSMTVDGQEILGTLAYQRPDDGRQDDRTVFSVQLPSPVPPGGTVSVDFIWTSKLPRVRRRTGLKGNFILLSHWFPKLGVYEEGKGWNCHQFHMNTEFYSDYGTYDVTLDLPAEYVGKIGASGVQVESNLVDGDEDGGPRVVARFLAPSMGDREYKDPVATGFDDPRPVIHGFAWTADPDYVVVDDIFDFSEWREQYSDEVDMVEDALGMPRNSLSLRKVNIKLLIQPERESQADRHIDATMAALFFYGLWFGEYPYEQVTVVDPAWGGSAAAGMEYPTLFTCGTSLFTEPAMHRPESVTVHEAGHQFWYGLVGNNEYENAWMDEGFNSFTDSEVMSRHYGSRRGATWYSGLPVWRVPVAAEPASTGLSAVLTGQRLKIHLPAKMKMKDISLAPLEASPFIDWWRDQPWLTFGEDLQDPRWSDRSGYLSSPDVDPVRTDGWRYMDRNSYRTNSYPRPAVVLRSLTAVIGYPAFLRGMRHYAAEWRYRHPYPQDFYAAFIEGSGQDVGWYFDELLEGTATVNWSVEVSQRRLPEPRGWFLRDGKYEEVPAQPESEAGENSEAEDAAADDPDAGDAAADDPDAGDAAADDPDAGDAAADDPDTGDAAADDPDAGDAAADDPDAGDAAADDPDAGDAADESETADGEPENAVGEPEIANPEDLEEADEKGEDESPWLYDVVVRRRGTLRLPVEIEVTFKDGSSQSFEWTREMQAESNWWRLPIPEGGPNQEITRVLIDPERRYFLDTDMSDNQWYKKRDTLVPMRWSERAYTQYVHLLHWFSSMGG